MSEVCSQLEVLYRTSGSQTTPPIRNNATFSREPTAAAAYMQPLPFAVLWRSKLMQSDRIGCVYVCNSARMLNEVYMERLRPTGVCPVCA